MSKTDVCTDTVKVDIFTIITVIIITSTIAKCNTIVYSISTDRLTALVKWYRENGLQPKEKRNAGHDNNTRAYSLDDTKRTVAFISNYADDHALVLPGRVPGFQRDDIRLMPSCETKVKVHAAYTTAMSNLGMCNYWHISLSL